MPRTITPARPQAVEVCLRKGWKKAETKMLLPGKKLVVEDAEWNPSIDRQIANGALKEVRS